MSSADSGDSKRKDGALDRRSILLAGSTFAVATAAAGLGVGPQTAVAQAQPVPSGRRPNILVIMGDPSPWPQGQDHFFISTGRGALASAAR